MTMTLLKPKTKPKAKAKTKTKPKTILRGVVLKLKDSYILLWPDSSGGTMIAVI